MAELHIRCLGDFRVTLTGVELTAFQTDKSRALLAYLALEGQVHQRTALAQFLWPGYSEESARNSLRQSLHQLRQALQDNQADPPWLLLTRRTVQLNPAASIAVDVTTFTRLLNECANHPHDALATCVPCRERLRQARDLYHGDFLTGFMVDDSPPFEDWRRVIQEQLHIQWLDHLIHLATSAESVGDDDGALQTAQQILTLEPWLEATHRQIMRLLAQRGQRAAALAQYQRCRQALVAEWGREPAAETTALYEQIQRGSLGGNFGGNFDREPGWQEPASSATKADRTNRSPGQPTSLAAWNNLPALFPPLIGRKRDVAEITTRLQQPGVRLLTLVGPGGMGKTRLALAVAADLATHFAAGVCMVELAELTDPALLPQTVAAALGQTGRANPTGEDSVTSYLRGQQLLLVLDNCEHLSEAAAYWCTQWLNACPDLCMLATSHGALNVAGEHVWPTPPLAYPPLSADLPPDQLLEYEAVKLFVARAQEVKADFALTATNSRAIAQICQRLEGIPLALRLAAAHVKLLTPTEIAARLSQTLDAALASNRGAPMRHQTMRSALNWSFESLDPNEQTLFQRLALFTGGFSLSALETVADLPDVLGLLSRLVDRALVTTETLGEQTRYRMLGLIREYAYDKLIASGEAQELRQRHTTYFLQLAERAQIDTEADGETLWLQPEAENLSAAIDWALTNEKASTAVRLAGALTWYWWMRGHLHARRLPLQHALAQLDFATPQGAAAALANPTEERALLAFAAGALLTLWGEPAKAWVAFEQALTLAQTAQHPQIAGLALRQLAAVAIQQKEYVAADTFIERGLALWQTLGGVWHIAWLHAHQGDLAYQRGDQQQAWLAYAASARLPVNPGARAYPLRRMAYLALEQGQRSQALALCRESLTLNLASGDRQGIAACLVALAYISVVQLQPTSAAPPLSRLRRAAQLLGAVAALLKTVEGQLLKVDEVVHQQTSRLLHKQLAEAAPTVYSAAVAEGQSMSLAQATDLALQPEELAPAEEPPASNDSHPLTALSPALPVVAPQPAVYDWSAMPAVDFLAGRSAEIAKLTTWLAPPADSNRRPAQLISILGMGGIGKTTLAAAVTNAVASNFSVVIWRSLLNAPLLSELLRSWLQVLSRQTLSALPESLDEQLHLLLGYLRQERCLLVLDNLESIFTADDAHGRAGVTRPGYEGYDQLLHWLGRSDHQSCVLFTSREQPYALVRLGRQAQETMGRFRVLSLTGLDQQAGCALLQSNGLDTSAPDAARLVESYSGNPLALQIVAGVIADFFEGDIAAFEQDAGGLFDGIRLVLDQQFARLSALEREILIWLAIEREAVTVQTLRSNFVQPASTSDLLEALQALQNRSLLEKSAGGLTLQNVIIEYTTEYLLDQVHHELTSEQEDKPGALTSASLNRFALMQAQAKEYVRQSQVRLILQPLANRLLAQMSKTQVEERVALLVQQLQAAGPTSPGYAGGNLLNLSVQIGSDLRGRDFSHLALWQAFLAGVYAPGLNLAGAELRGAVFTQRFSPQISFHFDHQGDLLLVDISSQRLRLLRLRDGLLYQEVALPALRILSAELSPGCDAVLIHLADHQLALLNLTTGQLFSPLVRHQHNIWRTCFSPDGRLVATGDSSGLVCIWDRQAGQLVQVRQISTDAVSALAMAPDGVTMASATVAGVIFLWSLADQTALRRFQGHDEEVATLTFLGNGSVLASGCHDMTIGLWDVATGELRQRLHGHTRPVRKSGATANGQWLVTGGGDHFLYVWDRQRGAPQHLLTDHAASIALLAVSADGAQAATIDLNSIISLWDLAQGQRIDFYPAYHNLIMSLQFTPDGETLVAGCSDGAVYLWQMEEGVGARMTARLTAHKERVFTVAVHPAGDLIASAGDGSVIALWERSSGRLLHTLQNSARNIAMLAISPDGHWLASSNGDGTVGLWSLPDGRQCRRLQVHTNLVSCCAFSPSRVDALGRPQQRLASGSFDHTLAVWDGESGQLLQQLRGHTNAIGRCLFSHDGQRLISLSYDETVRIWDVESGQPLAVWPQSGSGYIALALHPAGEILVVSCADHTLRLLELNSGRCLAKLVGHSQIVVGLCFHPNGQWLASAGADEMIKLWDFSADALNTGRFVCRYTLQAPAPYAGMKITGVTGVSAAQKAALMALGAVEA